MAQMSEPLVSTCLARVLQLKPEEVTLADNLAAIEAGRPGRTGVLSLHVRLLGGLWHGSQAL